MRRGQSFRHEHTLSTPKRRRPHLTENHFAHAFPSLSLGNFLKARARLINFAISNLAGHNTLRDTVGCPRGASYVSMPACQMHASVRCRRLRP